MLLFLQPLNIYKMVVYIMLTLYTAYRYIYIYIRKSVDSFTYRYIN